MTTLETYTYWIVMVVGLFTDQWSIFLSLIILTYISGAVADKLENNIKKFRAYFIFDKLVSLILLIIVLVQRWNTI
jgi:phage-related holin